LKKIAPHRDDMLRLAGSLKLGRVPAADIMRTLQVGDRAAAEGRFWNQGRRRSAAVATFARAYQCTGALFVLDFWGNCQRRASGP